MARRNIAAVLTALAVGLSGACSGGQQRVAPTTASSSASGSAPSTASTTEAGSSASGWYLALGDSLAAGFQPTTGDQPTRGYAGAVLEAVQADAPGVTIRNLGCSGETTTSMLRGGRCTYTEGSQLGAAVAFLRANAADTRLVTLDLGANNVLGCARPAPDQACASATTTTVGRDLGRILSKLRAAAPQAKIVVLTYYNPLLASWRQGADGQRLATSTVPLLDGLNASIAAAASGVGARVADVSGAFASSSLTASGSSEPVAVQRICAWTWMCSRNDIHANDEGYAAMAQAVIAAR